MMMGMINYTGRRKHFSPSGRTPTRVGGERERSDVRGGQLPRELFGELDIGELPLAFSRLYGMAWAPTPCVGEVVCMFGVELGRA